MPRKVVPGSITEPYKKGQGDFSPNLVGQQFTEGATLFTLGNFAITTNSSPPLSRVYNTGSFSESYCLDSLELTEQESEVLSNESISVILNLDPNDLSKYAYFGSFYEFIKSTIQTLILKWKGSLYVNSIIPTDVTATPKNTVLNYTYDSVNDVSRFSVPTVTVINNFGLIFDQETNFSSNEYGNIANLNTDFLNYQVSNVFGDFFVIGFSGNTDSYQYIDIEVNGNSWPGIETIGFGMFDYHIRPKENILNKYYFNLLDEFENNVLNRLTEPKYTMQVKVPKKTDSGSEYLSNISLTWPTTDGYNLDTGGGAYNTYINTWLGITNSFDEYKANLITRRFITASIIEFDTDGGGDERYGKKVDKLLKIYGREFDEIKQHVDALSFARVVTYNKKDNTPDELIKILASELGLDVLLSFFDNNLFNDVLPGDSTTEGYGNFESVPFSGYSRNLSPKEMDIELWRRLVINAWWLFKSKGHRKVLEFFLNLFGIENCAISLDEYIYIAKNRLNVNESLQSIADYLEADVSDITASDYPMDEYGFPKMLPNTDDYYYQLNGFWYNGGNLSEIGNNPHLGPYDYGKAYFGRLKCFIEDFNGSQSGTTTFNTLDNLFTDYEDGTIENGVPDYGENYAQIINDNNRISPNAIASLAGATNDIAYGDSNTSLRITFLVGESNCGVTCPIDLIYYENGVIFANDLTSLEITQNNISDLYADGGFYGELIDATQIPEECCDGYYLPITTVTTIQCPTRPEIVGNVVVGVNSRDCCTKDVVGSEVYWDLKTSTCIVGKQASQSESDTVTNTSSNLPVLRTPEQDVDLPYNPTPAEPQFPYFPIEDLFGNVETNGDDFVCYWCPPVKILCGEDYYLTIPQTKQNTIDLGLVDDDVLIEGCKDPTAINYNPLATLSCGPIGPYQLDLGGTLTSGCCIKNNTGPSGSGDDLDSLVILDALPLPCTGNFSITTAGAILLDGNPLKKECCTIGVVGMDVQFVNGECVLSSQINPPKCDTSSLTISTTGVVLGINTQDCCTKDVLGFDVIWNGKQCIINNQELCVIVSINDQNITDPKCCEIKGGYIVIDSAGNTLCVQKDNGGNQSGCPTQYSIKQTTTENIKPPVYYSEVLSSDGSKLSEKCCLLYASQNDPGFFYDLDKNTCLKYENSVLKACRYQLVESFLGVTYPTIHLGDNGIYSLGERVTMKLNKLIVNGVDYLQSLPTLPQTILNPTTDDPNNWNSVLFLQKIFNDFNLVNYKAQLPGSPANISSAPNSMGTITDIYTNGYGFYIIRPETDTFEIELDFYTDSVPPNASIGQTSKFIFTWSENNTLLNGTSSDKLVTPAQCDYGVDKTITPSNEDCYVVTNNTYGNEPQQCYPYILNGITYE